MLRIIILYALAAGLLISGFALLKSEWLFSGKAPEGYFVALAAVFMGLGWLLNRKSAVPAVTKIPSTHLLSRREQDVLEKLLGRDSNKQIADAMCIELSTLKSHINTIYRKLQVSNRRELLYRMSNEQ